MHIGQVIEDVYARCLNDRSALQSAIEEMVTSRWTDHDLGMHVACRLPQGTCFGTKDERRRAVIQDLIETCAASESVLRVVVATDVAMWTDEEIQAYGQEAPEPAPVPDMM